MLRCFSIILNSLATEVGFIIDIIPTNQAEGDNKSDEDEDDDDPASSAVTTCGSSDDFSEGWNFEWNLERSPSPDWEPENREAADIQPR